MQWVWQKKNWPNFEFETSNILSFETILIQNSGRINGRRDIESIDNYRQHLEPMQIISGNFNDPKIFLFFHLYLT